MSKCLFAVILALTLAAVPARSYTNDEAWRLYLDVCRFGSRAEMERFFELYDIDVNTKDPESGQTGLELAAKNNFHPDALRFLAGRGASRATLEAAFKAAAYGNTVEAARVLEAALDEQGGPEGPIGGRLEWIADKLRRGKKATYADLIDVLEKGPLRAVREMLLAGVSARKPDGYWGHGALEVFFARQSESDMEPEDMFGIKPFGADEGALAEVLELLLWRGADTNASLSFWVGTMFGGSAGFHVIEFSLPNLRMFEALLKAGCTEKLSKKTVTFGPEWPDEVEKPRAFANAATLWKKYQYYSKLSKAQRQTVRDKFFREMEARYQGVVPSSPADLLTGAASDGVHICQTVSAGTGTQLDRLLSRLDLGGLSEVLPDGAVPLTYRAARCNADPAVIDALMRVKKGQYDSYENSYKFGEYNPLLPAAQWNSNQGVVRALLLYGLDPGVTDKQGMTPLRLAAKYNPNPKVAETLYEARPEDLLEIADLIRENQFMSEEDREDLTLSLVRLKHKNLSESAFVDLCASGPAGDVALILHSGLFAPDVTADDGRTPLTAAAENGRVETVKVLLGAGAATGKTDAKSITPLMAAAHGGSSDTVAELLRSGADVNARNGNGLTPLMFLVAYCTEPAMIEQFLNAGANLEAQDANGWTPLCWAVANGDAKMITGLLTAGADVNIKPGGQNIVSLFQRNKYLSDEVKYSLSKDIRMMQR